MPRARPCQNGNNDTERHARFLCMYVYIYICTYLCCKTEIESTFWGLTKRKFDSSQNWNRIHLLQQCFYQFSSASRVLCPRQISARLLCSFENSGRFLENCCFWYTRSKNAFFGNWVFCQFLFEMRSSLEEPFKNRGFARRPACGNFLRDVCQNSRVTIVSGKGTPEPPKAWRYFWDLQKRKKIDFSAVPFFFLDSRFFNAWVQNMNLGKKGRSMRGDHCLITVGRIFLVPFWCFCLCVSCSVCSAVREEWRNNIDMKLKKSSSRIEDFLLQKDWLIIIILV